MYKLELRVPESLAQAGAEEIIATDRPMELQLTIQSSLITRERFVEATTAGFAKAAAAGHASDSTQAFLDLFTGLEFRKGAGIIMRYADGALVTRYRTAEGEQVLAQVRQLRG
jgi:hypothetical protein